MIPFLEIKYRGKKKSLGLLFCFTTSKQHGTTENSLSYWEYWSSNSCDVAVQFKYTTFSFHLTRTPQVVCLRRLLNLNLTYFKVASYLITFTLNTTHRKTYLDNNWFYRCSHSEIAQHIFVITPRSILGKKPQTGQMLWWRFSSYVTGPNGAGPISRSAFQARNRLICI